MTARELTLPQAASAPWRPAASLWVSAGVHVVGVATVAAAPEFWPVVGATVVGNHLLLTGAGLWPRSRLLGPNLVRLPEASARRREVALTFDDGPDPAVTPKVLDLLDAYGVRASFFCVAATAAQYPGLTREIVRRGHSVENHSLRHSVHFGWYGIGRLRREIAAAQQILSAITGRTPLFFRAPFGTRSPLLDPALARFGLRYVSWTRRGYDTVASDPSRVVQRLTRALAAGDILLLHDGRAAGRTRATSMTLAVLPPLLERIAAAGLVPVTLPAACALASAR